MKRSGRLAGLMCAACCVGVLFGDAAPASKLGSRWLLSQWHRRVWLIEEGLPHNYVTAISRDSERYLLVGTQTGVARFDGTRFTPFPALGEIWISSLLRASDGDLWAGTYMHGLYRVHNGHAEHWGKANGLEDHSVYSLVEDRTHRVWLASEGGFGYIEQGSVHMVARGRGTNGYNWQSLTLDSSGSVWFAAIEGLLRYKDGVVHAIRLKGIAGSLVTVYYWNGERQLYVGTTTGLYTLRCSTEACVGTAVRDVRGPVVEIRGVWDGALWVATWGQGLYRLAGERRERLSSREGLADDFVRTVSEDSEHNIWVGTRGGGLTRFRATMLKPVGIPEGLGGNCASVVTGDGEDGVWLGTWRSGLFHWRGGKLTAQPLPEPALNALITALALDRSRNLWIGTFDHLWELPRGKTKAVPVASPDENQATSHLLFTRDGGLWLAKENGGILLFESSDPRASSPLRILPSENITALLEDSKGSVWIGGQQGLWRVRANNGHQLEQIDAGARNVTALSEDSRGRVWAASDGGRITTYAAEGSRQFRYRNLPANVVYSILEDGHGGMWFSTGRGLARGAIKEIDDYLAASGQPVSLSAYGVAEGMRTIECRCARQPQSWKMADGTLWIPTAKGFIQIDAARNETLKPPQPVVEQISLDGKPMDAADTLTIPPGRHDVEARFTAIRLGLPEGVRFRYRLDGLEANWIETGGVRLAHYSQLPPGRFRLFVSARDAGGVWSDAASVGIEQRPHLYQTGWFRICMLAAMLGLVAFVYRLRLRVLRARYAAVIDERNRIARDFHDTLLAGLSAVSWQLDAALKLCAGHAVESSLRRAYGMLRYCRDEARQAVGDLRADPDPEPALAVAVGKKLDQLTTGTHVSARVEVDDKFPGLPRELSTDLLRICQEAASNAVRHGRASEIIVRLASKGGHLSLSVRDNGIGMDAALLDQPAAGHFGVLGMRERAKKFGGQLHVSSDPGGGTLVEAVVPLPLSNSAYEPEHMNSSL